ncbi:bet1-like SNARE 1-1 isoform X2 [Asparagus officinalis]|uniref:bet1-like SNARE 1-1 isoform X2 n=1 Tax=Asparagus officinalis TaxID=4686 RepID=UPI00098E2603|nr:bet1-like SNARE 1-1 isoform X2 [Asparagus officinalis]
MKLNRPFNASPPPPPSDLYLTDLKPYSLTLSDVGSQPKFTPFRNSCGGMNSRSNRTALFDGIEEGGTRAYSSHEIDEHENERAIDGLQDRVNILKRLTGDIHEEVDSHNRVLDRMGNDMDASRGVLSGTMDRFKMVFETKSTRRMATLVASFVALFLFIYYLTK